MKRCAFVMVVLVVSMSWGWAPPAQATPGLACSGTCVGISVGYATGTKKCADMTPAEITALKQQACDNTSKDDARSNANDSCDDNSGTCLCTGGKFSTQPANTGDKNGKCEANCAIAYKGDCNVVAIPVPLAAILPTLVDASLEPACAAD